MIEKSATPAQDGHGGFADALNAEIQAANTSEDLDGLLKAAGITPLDAADFLLKPLPPPEWIVPDFIAEHYQCALYGKSKTKKSFFGIQLAEAVATGSPFLIWKKIKRRRVVYLNLELMPYFIQERMLNQLQSTRVEKGYLHILNLRGRASQFRKLAEPPVDGNGNPTGEQSPFIRWLIANKIELVIIDPRYKLLQGTEDENTAAGLRALLELRTALAEACAVILIGHDPKGDVSNKALLDRGAGSYTAIADDDATILLTPNANGSEDVDALTVEAIHRNRKPIVPFVATFDDRTQTFAVDETISPDKNLNGTSRTLTNADRANRNAEKYRMFAQAAQEVAAEHGDSPIDCGTFKAEMSLKPNGNVMGGVTSKAFAAAWKLITESGEKHILKKCPVMEKQPDGTFKRTKSRNEYVSTPDRIDAYLKKCGIQDSQVS